MAKKRQTIYDQLNLSDYKNYDSIPPAKKAWITIKAKQQGKDPDKVHAQIERKMGSSKKTKKITTAKTTKKVGKKKTTTKASQGVEKKIKKGRKEPIIIKYYGEQTVEKIDLH